MNEPNVTEPHTVKMVNFTLYVLYYNFFLRARTKLSTLTVPCPDAQVHAQHSVSQRHPCPHFSRAPHEVGAQQRAEAG